MMKIVLVDKKNESVYANLYQGYAAEFSKIIGDRPDEDGLFKIDPKIGNKIRGYLLYLDGIPAALTAIAEKSSDTFEICDFYVLPCFRKNKVGKRFISALFERLKGAWEIKQVEGAENAVTFWREVLNDYTKGQYVEDLYLDEKWGVVTRQCFDHSKTE